MRKALGRFAKDYLVILVYLVLVFLLFRIATTATRENTQLSLRYTDYPITAGQAAGLQEKAANPTERLDFIPAFWFQQHKVYLETDYTTTAIETPGIFVDGDMSGVYAATFIQGTYPSYIDKQGIAISEGLAWRLFGGGSLLGAELAYNDTVYYVRGIFEGDDNMLLMQQDSDRLTDNEYTGVELYGSVEGDARSKALSFAQSEGLGTPNSVISGSAISGLLMLMALVPVLILLAWFVYKLMRQVYRLPYVYRQLVWFVFLLGLAFLIPYALGRLPAWIVPNKWSDMDTWARTVEEAKTRINEILFLWPSFRDVQLKIQLIVQVLLLFPAVFSVITAIRIWNQKLTWFNQRPAAETEGTIEEEQREDIEEDDEKLQELLR